MLRSAVLVEAALLAAESTLLLTTLALFLAAEITLRLTLLALETALLLAIVMPDLLANLLLTFSGLDQLAPAIAAAIFFRGRLSVRSIIAGLAAGLIVVIAYTVWLPLPWPTRKGRGACLRRAASANFQIRSQLGCRLSAIVIRAFLS